MKEVPHGGNAWRGVRQFSAGERLLFRPLGSAHAYTLLEICIVLAIMAIMAGMAMPMMRNSLREEPLWSAVRQLRALALDSRRAAIQSGRTWAIQLGDSSMGAGAWPTANRRESERAGVARGVRIECWDARRRRWEPASIEWIFQPSGICDPMQVRFHSDAGWVEQVFSPLTATTEDEAWYFD